jgi:C-terminal processing protease CtpA/Prc
VLTGGTTFSGVLAYDLQQLGCATIVGERAPTPGSPSRLHPHLEATIPVVKAIHPTTRTSWEGVGVRPDVVSTAAEAEAVAMRLASEASVATTVAPR